MVRRRLHIIVIVFIRRLIMVYLIFFIFWYYSQCLHANSFQGTSRIFTFRTISAYGSVFIIVNWSWWKIRIFIHGVCVIIFIFIICGFYPFVRWPANILITLSNNTIACSIVINICPCSTYIVFVTLMIIPLFLLYDKKWVIFNTINFTLNSL